MQYLQYILLRMVVCCHLHKITRLKGFIYRRINNLLRSIKNAHIIKECFINLNLSQLDPAKHISNSEDRTKNDGIEVLFKSLEDSCSFSFILILSTLLSHYCYLTKYHKEGLWLLPNTMEMLCVKTTKTERDMNI